MERINDTLPSYRLENLPERYHESLIKRTEIKKEKNNTIMKKLNLSYIKHSLSV